MATALDPGELGIEFDGLGIEPPTADPILTMNAAVAYFRLLRASAASVGRALDLQGLAVHNKCVAVATTPRDLSAATAAVQRAADVLSGAIEASGDERARAADFFQSIGKFPSGIVARVVLGEVRAELPRETEAPVRGAWSVTSFRGKVMRVGGRDPRIAISTQSEKADVVLELPDELTDAAARALYRLVDVECVIARTKGVIDAGKLKAISVVPTQTGKDPWRTWFKPQAKAWDEVEDIEEALDRTAAGR